MEKSHVVFGAGGGAGSALVRALAARGKRVRAVTRSGIGDVPEGVDDVRNDARDLEAARTICQDAEVVYHCVNVPYAKWAEMLPDIMGTLITSAGEAGAPLVYCDNLYMYDPPSGPLHESSPTAASGPKGQLRARLSNQLLEAHEQGRVEATIGRASDFFGPVARNTVAGQLVFPAVVDSKRAHWIGSLDQPHSLHYIDDVAAGLITLGTDTRALGEIWHLPAPPPTTAREFIATAFDVAGKPPKMGVYRRWMVWLAGFFDRQMREVREVLYQFEEPFVIDARKYVDTFGEPSLTPMREAVTQTLAWERVHRST